MLVKIIEISIAKQDVRYKNRVILQKITKQNEQKSNLNDFRWMGNC